MIKCKFFSCKNHIVPRWGTEYCSDECRVLQHRLVAAAFFKKHQNDPQFIKRRLKNTRAFNRSEKILVLTRYGKGGKLLCCWRGCNIEDADCLTLDHINDNGAKHKREILKDKSQHSAGSVMIHWVKKANFPPGFQTLCANHQMKKEVLRRKRIANENNRA